MMAGDTVAESNRGSDILVAEDSNTQAKHLRAILEGQGYRVTIARDGREALALGRQRRPALVITDVVMPEMDGFDLCRAIKQDPALAGTPVILLTSLSDPEDVIRGLECQADNFIIKPFDEGNLLGRVRHVLHQQGARAVPEGMGVEIFFHERRHSINADRMQILNLLLSTYDAAIQRNRELRRTQMELQRSNEALKAANEELDAFSFAVSHDLRSPLATIAALAKLLERFSGPSLDERGRTNVRHIVEGIARMIQLIDDLLGFARTAREELVVREVDLNPLVREVMAELQPQCANRRVEWRVHPLPIVQGDSALLRLVLVNYLSNAVKYTGKREVAVIEVGPRDSSPDEDIVYVRDNGAGFDMQYASRLFGVFQRLHPTSAFEGTGVGLSNVRRIINRHGGRTWAEAAVDQGATFYFALPRRR